MDSEAEPRTGPLGVGLWIGAYALAALYFAAGLLLRNAESWTGVPADDLPRIVHAGFSAALVIAAPFVGLVRAGRLLVPGEGLRGGQTFRAWAGRLLRGVLPLLGLALLDLLALSVDLLVSDELYPISLLVVACANLPAIPMALLLGTAARLLVRDGLVAGLIAIGALVVLGTFPLLCCLPSFNPPLLVFFGLDPMPMASGDVRLQLAIAAGMSLAPLLGVSGLLCLLIWWRVQVLTREREVSEARQELVPCRHCGERIAPETRDECPVCGEELPLG